MLTLDKNIQVDIYKIQIDKRGKSTGLGQII
jgi:hypothetical protein